MKIIETGGITILIDSKQFESFQNTSTTKEKEMKKEMKKPINCRIISSNLEDKTLGLKFELAKDELLEIHNKEYI